MSRKTVIMGGGGFVGQWMAKALLHRGDRVWLGGLGDRPGRPAILTGREWGMVEWRACDVLDDAAVGALLTEAAPDWIVHLAGISFVPRAEREPTLAYETNVLGALRVALAAAQLGESGFASPSLLVVGSGTQYGTHPASAMPLPESAEQRPASVYAATKAAQEAAVLQIGRSRGLRVVCTRSFNHSGAGQEASFLLPALAGRVREIGDGERTLRIGNDVVRDYLHVTDVVDAYIALLERGTAGECYNVCSGRGVGVRQLASLLLARAGVDARVELDDALARRAEMPILVGSPEKLIRDTGWEPRRSYTDIVDDVLAGPPTR